MTRTAHAPPDPVRPARAARGGGRLPVVSAATGVLLQILWPLASGADRDRLTVAVVVLFAAAGVAGAAATGGTRRAVALLAVTAVPGFAAEVVGVNTGVPFGSYRYSAALGPQLLGVPLVVALAWTMLAWPSAAVARRLARGPVARVLLGAWAMTAGDLFLDPQMVAAGAWTWLPAGDAGAHLPGVPGVPLSNLAGWLLVSLVLSALVQLVAAPDALGRAVYVWFWLAWTLALAAFLHLPVAAAWGFAGMGSVGVPLLAREAARSHRWWPARERGYGMAMTRSAAARDGAAPRTSRARLTALPDGPPAPPADVAGHLARVEALLDDRLDELGRAWHGVVDAPGVPLGVDPPALLGELVRRGGKRTRPAMTYLGWVAAGGPRDGRGYPDVVRAAAALELLHAFALVHDDVMDESLLRRGRETLHRGAAGLHADTGALGDSARFGESVAVLTGDLAHAEADRLAAELPPALRDIWRGLVLELVAGQLCDLTGTATADRRLSFARGVVRQKTGNYTVARPLQLGAAAAGAGEATLAALAAYGRHAGEAFGLRDELLGVFGDPGVTGKPSDDDLRAGKPTVLLAVAAETVRGDAADALARVGTPGLGPADLGVLRRALVDQGVVARVEAMVDERVADAASALRTGAVAADGVAQLTRVLGDLARRGR